MGALRKEISDKPTSIVDNITKDDTKDDFSQREDLDHMSVWNILINYGETLIRCVGYEECKRWYGPIFEQWYSQYQGEDEREVIGK